ncbi:hypothetical protein FD755_023962, partial [Muntiacus reevesi]
PGGYKAPLGWLNPLFKIGSEQKLKQDDLYSVLPEDRSQHLGEELQGYWDREVLRAKKDAREPSLMRAIVKCYWKFYFILGLLTFLEEGTKVVQPIFLGKIIIYVENYDPTNYATLYEAYGYAAALSACVLLWAILHHLCFYHIQRVGMRLRVAVCHMIYRKAVRLNNSAMGKTTTGQIVNLLSNDVNRFDQVTMFFHYLWVGPLLALTVTTLLWIEIGMPCLAGMAILIILLLLQSCFGKLFSSLRSKTAALTDDRIRTISEFITGIRTIKMYAWENLFANLITISRRWIFVGKVMSLLFNMLSRLVITFLPRSKHRLISWLQSPSAVILETKIIKSAPVSNVSPSICHEVMGPDAMILVF